jgi:hypothetical protein
VPAGRQGAKLLTHVPHVLSHLAQLLPDLATLLAYLAKLLPRGPKLLARRSGRRGSTGRRALRDLLARIARLQPLHGRGRGDLLCTVRACAALASAGPAAAAELDVHACLRRAAIARVPASVGVQRADAGVAAVQPLRGARGQDVAAVQPLGRALAAADVAAVQPLGETCTPADVAAVQPVGGPCASSDVAAVQPVGHAGWRWPDVTRVQPLSCAGRRGAALAAV